MLSSKGVIVYGKHYTRKDRRATNVGAKYKAYYHYSNRSRLKWYRKHANRQLRRHHGDVGNHGWYKKFTEVVYMAF